MSVVKKLCCGVFFLLMVFSTKAQQTPQFSLGFLNRMFSNPGYAGNTTENLFTATALNRLEMTGFEGAPVITVVDLHGPVALFGISSGVGVSLYNDMAGALRAPGFSLTYAYRHKIFDGTIGIGVTAGLVASWYTNQNWRLPEGEGSDPSVPTNEIAGMNFDMDLGAYYQSSTWFGGVACKHLTEPRLGVDKKGSLPRTLYANLGYAYAFDESEWMIMPMVDLVSDFAQTGFSLKTIVYYKKIYWAGLAYRWNQAIVGMLGIELFEGLKIAYAYEYLISELNRFSGGCHELLLNYSFAITIPKGSQRYKSIRYL
ncbi:MAG: PorP/SprF family type IX secretion system membrane protein [Prevotellaceae bacterium]|jgi:type IX secretion system PorP/SprF family membrane protein|nr:PorP/SprF family type IX secretion system membrane protein [Prevotellaceae bacterium]